MNVGKIENKFITHFIIHCTYVLLNMWLGININSIYEIIMKILDKCKYREMHLCRGMYVNL